MLPNDWHRWSIYLGRRIKADDSHLIGFVVSKIDVDYFDRLFAKLIADCTDETSETALQRMRADGMLLLRYPHVDARVGTMGNHARILAAPDNGVSRITSVIDGRDRLVAAHSVSHHALYLVASNTVHAILLQWRTEIRAFVAIIIFIEQVLAGMILLVLRQMRNHGLCRTAGSPRSRISPPAVLQRRDCNIWRNTTGGPTCPTVCCFASD